MPVPRALKSKPIIFSSPPTMAVTRRPVAGPDTASEAFTDGWGAEGMEGGGAAGGVGGSGAGGGDVGGGGVGVSFIAHLFLLLKPVAL
jgi:hypothetical protein